MRPTWLVLLSACATPELGEVVDRFVEEQALSLLECGRHAIPTDCEFEALPAPAACVLDAWASCLPARATLVASTIEGAEIVTTWVVHPGAGGECALTLFRDDSADEFAEDPGIVQSTCEGLEMGVSACAPLEAQGCAQVERW